MFVLLRAHTVVRPYKFLTIHGGLMFVLLRAHTVVRPYKFLTITKKNPC